ncbi:transposable element Tcb1 transposase [Trichonephila clavipes]|nr:transposable element Tcb1 transposase [Trichonephila clavipes]
MDVLRTDHSAVNGVECYLSDVVVSDNILLGLGSNLGDDMDVSKCIVPLRRESTLNNRQAASHLVRLVEEEERYEAHDHLQGVIPLNRGGTEQKKYAYKVCWPNGTWLENEYKREWTNYSKCGRVDQPNLEMRTGISRHVLKWKMELVAKSGNVKQIHVASFIGASESGSPERPRHKGQSFSRATGTTVSRQTVQRRLGHVGLYARKPVRCVPLNATHCRLRLTWSREHALWTPQQWSCVIFSDESRFSLQSDSRRTLIWRVPGTCYHQDNTIERHRYGGAGWLVWGGIILGSRTDLYVQSVTMTGHIYRDVILEQHVRLFRGTMGDEFLFMDDSARPHRANIVDECLQSEDINRVD